MGKTCTGATGVEKRQREEKKKKIPKIHFSKWIKLFT